MSEMRHLRQVLKVAKVIGQWPEVVEGRTTVLMVK